MIVYMFGLLLVFMIVSGIIYSRVKNDLFPLEGLLSFLAIESFILMVIYMFVPCVDIIKTETFETEIVSIRSQNSVGGSFLIGCGSIGTEQYYVYMKKLEDGSYKQNKLPVERCRIYENSNLEPRVEWDMVTRVLPVWMSFGFDWIDNITKQEGDYRIIVPENTIIQSFEIN